MKLFPMLHPPCHGRPLELTSNRPFKSFNAGRFDGRAGTLVAQRRRALILIGAPVYHVLICWPRQRYPSTMHPYVSPAGQPKHPASLTVHRRVQWASSSPEASVGHLDW